MTKFSSINPQTLDLEVDIRGVRGWSTVFEGRNPPMSIRWAGGGRPKFAATDTERCISVANCRPRDGEVAFSDLPVTVNSNKK